MFHIIDDEEILREFTESILVDCGFDVLCFESGNQYLEYLNSPKFKKPIAVLSDVTMPGINGYDLALEIRKILPFQKIILITGNADPEHYTEAAKQVCYTLNKPYSPEKLISIIQGITACNHLYASNKEAEYPQMCSINPLSYCPFSCQS